MDEPSLARSGLDAPLQRVAMFTSGLTLGVAMAVLAWAIVVARS